MSILFADIKCSTIHQYFSKQYSIVETSSSKETLFVLQQQTSLIEAIFIDMTLFRSDEYFLSAKISKNSTITQIPIICIGAQKMNKSSYEATYREALEHGALGYFFQPVNFQILQTYLCNILKLKKSIAQSREKVHNDTDIYKYQFIKSDFVNSDFLRTISMHINFGSACIIERIHKKNKITQVAENFERELLGDSTSAKIDIENFFTKYIDEGNYRLLNQTLDNAVKQPQIRNECTMLLTEIDSQYSVIHLRIRLKLIEQIHERCLFYCVIENDTEKFTAQNREAELTSQMNTLIKNFNGGITVTYEDFGTTTYAFANDMFYAMIGYTKEELRSTNSIFELILPEYISTIRKSLNLAMSLMKPVQMMFQAQKHDGTIMWVRARSSVYYIKSLGKISYITFYEDITSLMAEQKRIQVLNDKLGISEVFMQLNLTEKKLEQYHSIYEPEIAIDKGVEYKTILLNKVYQAEKESTWNVLSYQNLLKNFAEGNTKVFVEYRRYMPDKKIRWFVATAILLKDIVTETLHAFIYTHDIDDKKKTLIAKDMIMTNDISKIYIINIESGICQNVKLNSTQTFVNFPKNERYDTIINRFIDLEIIKDDQRKCREFFPLHCLIRLIKNREKASLSFWITNKDGERVYKNATVCYLDDSHQDLLIVEKEIADLSKKIIW